MELKDNRQGRARGEGEVPPALPLEALQERGLRLLEQKARGVARGDGGGRGGGLKHPFLNPQATPSFL